MKSFCIERHFGPWPGLKKARWVRIVCSTSKPRTKKMITRFRKRHPHVKFRLRSVKAPIQRAADGRNR